MTKREKDMNEAAANEAERLLNTRTTAPINLAFTLKDYFKRGVAWSEVNPNPEVLDLVAMVEHAIHLGYLGEGSTKGWAERALSNFRKEEL